MQKSRRAHTKSRAGCLTCKRRRVRCDEFKPTCSNCLRLQLSCGYSQSEEPDTTGGTGIGVDSSSGLTYGGSSSSIPTDNSSPESICRAVGYLPPIEGGSPLSTFTLSYSPMTAPDLSPRDRSILAFVHRVSDDLYMAQADGFFWGTKLLNEFTKMAVDVAYVREALCSAACTHLSLLAGSAPMANLAYHYRQAALHGLRQSLANLSVVNVDAILATSMILSWQAPESAEFVLTLKGVDIVLKQMEEMNLSSDTRSLFIYPLCQTHSNIVGPHTSSSSHNLEQACTALQDFIRISKHDQEITRGLRELHNYLVNLQADPPGDSVDAQFEALFPIRWSLTFFPRVVLNLPRKEPWTIAVAAHYNMVVIAIESFLPAVRNAFGLSRRAEIVSSLYMQDRHRTKWSRSDNQLFETLMQEPLAMSKAYLARKSPNPS